jgi:hypothetical protein
MEKIKTKDISKIVFILLSICMAIPSCIYLLNKNSILNLEANFSFFINLSTENITSTKIIGTILFFTIWVMLTVLYFYIIKNHDKIFKSKKSIITTIVVVAVIFTIILPMTSTDVFYYIGTGWSEAHYGVNPYYTSVDELMIQNEQSANDEILLKMKGTWSGQTVVYGPIWPMVCKVLSYMSLGNLGVALLIYKLFNLIIHIANCYIVYKMTNKNRKYMIMYALNPLVLFEGLSNAHNEILVIFFIAIALYFLVYKKKIIPAIIFLACATAVKYFAILLAPFFVLYYYKNESITKKVLHSIKLAIIFILTILAFYCVYMNSLNDILKGIFTQQGKFSNSIILPIAVQNFGLADNIAKGLMIAFIIIYIKTIIELLITKKQYTFNEYMKIYNNLLLIFIFGIITNFQPWYVIWIMPTIFWQADIKQVLLLAMTSVAQFATIIYFLLGDSYKIGQFYMFVFAIALAGTVIIGKLIKNKEIN